MADSTDTMNDAGMSSRGWSNVSAIMPKIQGAVAEREKRDNPNIDLSTAENWLIRPELIELCKKAISTYLVAQVSIDYRRRPHVHRFLFTISRNHADIKLRTSPIQKGSTVILP
jgi:hypothetical protein